MNIGAQELGRRIADSRQRGGHTQAALAEQLGIARTTVVAMEKGARRPSDEELVRICKILQVPVHELVQQSYTHNEVMARFRSVAGGAQVQVDEAVLHLERLGRQYAELERLQSATPVIATLADLSAFRAGQGPELSAKDARRSGQQAARTVRSLLGIADAPVQDLESVLEIEAGLRIFHLMELPAGISAMLVWGTGIGACVGIHAGQPPERRRWSLAHEFGHFLRDRETGDVLPTGGPGRMDASEHFAEGCASELLLPASGVSRQFEERRRNSGGRFLVADIIQMRHHFGVSFQAMTLRLEELDHLPRETYQRICQGSFKLSSAEQELGFGGAVRFLPPTVPARYRNLVLTALDDGELSETEASTYLELSRLEVRALLQAARWQRGDDGGALQLALASNLLEQKSGTRAGEAER